MFGALRFRALGFRIQGCLFLGFDDAARPGFRTIFSDIFATSVTGSGSR